MKKTKIISKILYALTRSLAWIYLVIGLYGIFAWITKTNIKTAGTTTIINYPFTDVSFLILDNNLSYFLFAFLIPVLSYTLFFWLLSNVFSVFYQNKLFTQPNIKHLKRFYLANIILPMVLVAFSSFFIEIEKGIFIIIALHLVLGIFIFIISEIFNQGLSLQNEQDLYI
ncbi:hypothetical protein Murru_2696 [Allomuricauda ruestringensis DSM 13258]|uniref:DUF2975 domain-containing protein n=1 Tax=Allomuricauda ruestringensis (strain DSM 13258 / CIP 107369 / LMG 19739 / B1) TaxID=886377 RepID=G2PIB0_ALLRU|nr:DUF2975 domain-containing protein [Allomuricauda ruestringensis]AEM71728.1 hypothetical protein Murru_2696 [Allomuricauda ruestringensis DSM 13258]